MEGGKKYNVNLESGLDVSSSDMLVPVSQPTFQHNWQKYQGKFLPNSLRFEKNGWAAGWNVIDFAYSLNRLEVDGKFISALKLNQNPTYLVCVYDTSDSDKVVYEKKVMPESKALTNNITITSENSSDTIKGVLSNNKAFEVKWSPVNEEAELYVEGELATEEDFSFTSIQNVNYIRTFSIEDLNDKYSVNNNLYTPSALTGSGLINPIAYTKFDGEIHYWGSVEFNSTSVTMPDSSSVSSLTIEGNTITFNAQNTRPEQLGITYTIDKYFGMFNRCNARQASGDYMTVATDAHSAKKYNYYKVALNKRSLAVSDSLPIDIKVPVWTSINIKVEFDEYEGVMYPNNTECIDVRAPAEICEFVYNSVFDGKDVVIECNGFKGYFWSLYQAPYRYGSLTCNNTISGSDTFTGKPVTINDSFWAAGTYRFKTLRNYADKREWIKGHSAFDRNYGSMGFYEGYLITGAQFLRYTFGECIDWGDIEHDPKKYVDYNEWVNWHDPENPVYIDRDISRYHYIKLKGNPNQATKLPDGFNSDVEYFMSPEPGVLDDETMTKQMCHMGNKGWDEYGENDPAVPFEQAFRFKSTGAYITDTDSEGEDYVRFYCYIGEYIAGTYKTIERNYSTGSDCQPFFAVPCINVEYKGTVYKHVYGVSLQYIAYYDNYVPDILKVTDYNGRVLENCTPTFYTDLDEFLAYVMGKYDSSLPLYNTPFTEFDSTKIKRLVCTYMSICDFDWSSMNDSEQARAGWDAKWNKWYPDIANPADIRIGEASGDDKYLDYENIEIRKNQALNVQSRDPAIRLHTYSIDVPYPGGGWTNETFTVYLKCFNKYDVMPWINAPEVSAAIYENHEDVSSEYYLPVTHTDGTVTYEKGLVQDDCKILLNYNESDDSYDDSVTIHGYFGESKVLSDLITVHDVAMFLQRNTWHDIKVKLKTGRIAYYGECRTYNDTDGNEYTFPGFVKEFGLTYTDGKLNNYADKFNSSGKKERRFKYTTVDGIERIIPANITRNDTDGIVLAQPFWAHLLYELKYKDYGSEVVFSSDRDSVMKLSKIEDASSILDPTKTYIFADRSSTSDFPLSREWFDVEFIGVTPSEKAQFKLKAVSDGQLYYSTKQTGSDGKELEYDTCYPTIVGYSGNMKSINSNMCQFDIAWAPDIFYMPRSLTFDFTTDMLNPLHVFYAKAKQIFNGISYNIDEPSDGYTNGQVNISLVFDTEPDVPNRLNLVFDTKKQNTYIKSSTQSTHGTQDIDLTSKYNTVLRFTNSENAINKGKVVNLPMEVTYSYDNITGKFAMSEVDVLKKWDSGIFTCRHNNRTDYMYNSQSKRIVDQNTRVLVNEIEGGENIQFTSSAGIASFSAVLRNIVNNRIELGYNDIVVEDASSIFEIDNSVVVKSVDIRKPNDTIHIGKLDVNNYQLLKQDWDTTVSTENFWWVDDSHILALTNEKFILKRKTDKLSDWNGDEFIPISETLRSSILNEHTVVYFVTNTYKCTDAGLFITMQAEDDTTIKCKVYNIRPGFSLRDEIILKIKYKAIGEQLNNNVNGEGKTAYINTYNQITAKQLLSQAKWTNTVTDNRLFIGCHLSNNFDQWTAIFSLGDLAYTNCIQGYGFVGIKGDLTGGMIPSEYFDVSKGGFNSTVQDISVICKNNNIEDGDSAYRINSVNDINKIEKRVVGNSERQWYIQKELFGIVSHIRYDKNGQFIVESLPITNKYDAIYKSPSFHSYAIGDAMVQAMPFEGLFNFSGAAGTVWSIVCKACGYPLLYAFSPRISTLAYLQQTLGQYAYVHYNSMESPDRTDRTVKNMAGKNNMSDTVSDSAVAPILSDELTFDKQIIEQKTLNTAPFDKFITLLFGMFAPPLQHIDRNLVVNQEVNTTAVYDTGKKFSQFVMENLEGLGPKALLTESNEQAISSKVVGIKSLDMFYSTSDKQHIYAGPGFVEHQMVANCVAQSVTDCAAEGQVRQLTLILKSLTAFQGLLTCKLEELAAQGMHWAADATKEAMVCGNNVGAYVAIGLHAAAMAIKVAQAATEMAYAALDKILDTITTRGVTCEDTGRISRYSLTPEAKHKYGEKNEVFMWPCMGVPEAGLEYKDETVAACIKKSVWQVNLQATKCYIQDYFIQQVTQHFDDLYTGDRIEFSSATQGEKKNHSTYNNYGDVDFYSASCVGSSTDRPLPSNMACIQGVESFLPNQPFKNENISCSNPVFTPSMFQDYIIDKAWDLTQCCTYGLQQWITVKDTKVTNCPPSNMRINDTFCGISTSYAAIEVKRGLSKSYMRPWAITPNILALNCTGYNAILDNKLYHAFDGMSYRLVEWKGVPAMNKNFQTKLYGFQLNDRFKRSNKLPANEVLGNFSSEPVQYIDSIDKFWTQVTVAVEQSGLENSAIGEDKDATRWSLPVFTEPVTTLPAAVKTLTAMPLNVFDGITGLTTNLMNNQTAYKAPLSVDFTIGKNVYRQTEEYICAVQTEKGLDIITDIIPSLGLKFIGSTPTEAYFYSSATRCYYMFTGSNLVKMDMMERFRDIQRGYWDFVNQEVVMPCLMTFKRLNPEVLDTDTETDNIIVPLMSRGQVTGELPPPLTTLFNDKSWYKCVSLPAGFAYQGPNRVIINRSIFTEYMLDSLKSNLGKWAKVSRDAYVNKREYAEVYDDITKSIDGVDGWTYNPFLLVTSPFGIDEETDCIFEWVITFCWPIEMDLIYGLDNYACVNVVSETMTPGGKQKSSPTHIFLTKELFTRSGSYGYYSFRYQSKNGIGNRERLNIWSDQYIAISNITCEVKPVTQRRTEQLTQQQDVFKLKEL